MIKLTIFTPTYNRENLLQRVFKSLKIQKNKDFEWLIVDDGSTDNTEEIVKGMIEDGSINIRYIKKKNGGKHTAHNIAVKNAKAAYFMCLDSDDLLSEGAVEKIIHYMQNIQKKDCGIIAHKKDMMGNDLGHNLPMLITKHMGLYGYQKKYVTTGEFVLVFRTDILREHLFPVISGEKFMTESVLYDKLELNGFSLCPVDDVFQICEYQSNGLSQNTYKLLCNNPAGYTLYYYQRIKLSADFKDKVRYSIRFNAFKSLAKRIGHESVRFLNWSVILTLLPGKIGSYYYLVKQVASVKGKA